VPMFADLPSVPCDEGGWSGAWQSGIRSRCNERREGVRRTTVYPMIPRGVNTDTTPAGPAGAEHRPIFRPQHGFTWKFRRGLD